MPPQKLKILTASSECAPLAKVGGLADVVGSLPKALKKEGLDIRVILPKYGMIDDKKYGIKKLLTGIKVPLSGRAELVDVYSTVLPGSRVPLYLVKHNFFDFQTVYNIPGVSDARRFAFFTKACFAVTRALNWRPDVFHCHDWHLGLAPFFIKTFYKDDKFYVGIKTLYTVHNLEMTGWLDEKSWQELFDDKETDFVRTGSRPVPVAANIMNYGLEYADLINTVSPNYAQEILTQEYGAGFEKILQKRRKDLYGIINGLDTDVFDPAKDKFIKQKYNQKSIGKKIINKKLLQKKCGLKQDVSLPVLGIVSRLFDQKGIDLLLKIMPQLAETDLQLVVLGTGDKNYERELKDWANRYPDKFFVNIEFNLKFAMEIYAGADMFLMPSRFEPCGLGQLIAMRYGTVPVVRVTGGLKDTVKEKPPKNTGFVFKKYDADEFLKAIKCALRAYKNKKVWRKLMLNGMTRDFSWKASAKEYAGLYEKLVK